MTNKYNALLTGLRMSVCGVICFTIHVFFDFNQDLWSVVTISAITRPNLSGTFVKALLRLLGTIVGVLIGLIGALVVGNSPILLFLFILLFTTITTYAFGELRVA